MATPASTNGRSAPSHEASETPSPRRRASSNAHSSAARAARWPSTSRKVRTRERTRDEVIAQRHVCAVDGLAVVLGRCHRRAFAPPDSRVGLHAHEQRVLHRGGVARGAERRDERNANAHQLDLAQHAAHLAERTREEARARARASSGDDRSREPLTTLGRRLLLRGGLLRRGLAGRVPSSPQSSWPVPSSRAPSCRTAPRP